MWMIRYHRYIPMIPAIPSSANGAGAGSLRSVKIIPTTRPVHRDRSTDSVVCMIDMSYLIDCI